MFSTTAIALHANRAASARHRCYPAVAVVGKPQSSHPQHVRRGPFDVPTTRAKPWATRLLTVLLARHQEVDDTRRRPAAARARREDRAGHLDRARSLELCPRARQGYAGASLRVLTDAAPLGRGIASTRERGEAAPRARTRLA